MEVLKNAISIPHISGKLVFGYSLDVKSFSECERRWNMLSENEKSKFVETSKKIRNEILLKLTPLQNWNNSELEISQKKLFYIMNYPSQLYLFPHLAESQILRKCGKKLNLIKKEKQIFEIFDKYLRILAKYKCL